MQVSVEQTGALERRMEVSVPSDRVEQAIDKRLQQVGRTAKLKGFRPGKAPLKVIRQQFGAQVRQEVVGDLMQSSFAEAVTQQKLAPGRRPAHRADRGGGRRGPQVPGRLRGVPRGHARRLCRMTIEPAPEVEITDADIDEQVEMLRRQHAEVKAVKRPSRWATRCRASSLAPWRCGVQGCGHAGPDRVPAPRRALPRRCWAPG